MAIDVNKKLAGLMIPVFALRSGKGVGIGDTIAVCDAIDFCATQGFGVLQMLPITETGGDHSPYNAISSVSLDPVLLSMTPETVPGLTQEIIDQHVSTPLLQQLRQGPVDYPVVKRTKMQLLVDAYARFEEQEYSTPTSLTQEFDTFLEEHKGWLPAYTLFRTLLNEYDNNSCWTQWRSEHQNPLEAEKWRDNLSQAEQEEFDHFREFSAFVQWVAFRQWRNVKKYATSKNVRLMGDMPFGISRYSADAWAYSHLFDLSWSCGAPPEPFFQTDVFTTRWGQNWGIPLYRWNVHREQNYEWWHQRVHALLESFHDFRIDHVLGFFRIYSFPWIPERNSTFTDLSPHDAFIQAGERSPQFLPGPDEPEESARRNEQQGEEILRALIENLHNTGVVAEDLGMVPKYVRPLLQRLGIPGFAIPTFERDEQTRDFLPANALPPLSLTTYATHDHAPIALFYNDLVKRWKDSNDHEAWLDLQRLMKLIGLHDQDPPLAFNDAIHTAMEKTLLESPSWLVVFMITDALATTQRFNLPGLSSDLNWSQRMELSLEECLTHEVYGPKLQRLRSLIVESGRAPWLKK